MQARDAFDNDITMGGAVVEGSLVAADGTEVPLAVVDNGDGTYSCSYPSVKKAGTYQITPKLNGTPISGAPFSVVVKPGAFSLENTEVEFPAVSLFFFSVVIIVLFSLGARVKLKWTYY